MIPALIDLGPPAPWPVLPAGIHWATMDEIAVMFATNEQRRRIFGGFRRVVLALELANCAGIYLDGSFVTASPCPDDFDGCWDPIGVDVGKLDPVLLDFTSRRAAQRAKFLGEMFISSAPAAPGITFLDFFQQEKHSGRPKGLIRVRA